MEINEALYSYLSSYTALTTYVSNRIYPQNMPQSPKYPCVSYSRVSEEETETMETPASTMIGPTYQFDCWATASATAHLVAKQIRAAFKNYSGLTGGVGGVTISGVEKINTLDNTYTDADGRIIAHVVSMDFQIWYQE